MVRFFIFLILFSLSLYPAYAAELTAKQIIDRSEDTMRSDTSRANAQMTIKTPDWERTLTLNMWDNRPKKTFLIRILSPAKEAGVGTLKIGNNLWNYLPSVEKVIKIPPSMMGNSWMGSDFTNDDLTKESETDDYTYTLVGTETRDGYNLYKIECIPKPDSPVVWGKVLQWIRMDNYLPYRVEFYDEKGKLIKTLEYFDYKTLGGRVIPTRWVMKNVSKEGNNTIVQINRMEFDIPISDEVFTLRNLQKTK